MRLFIHLDLNQFFVTCERLRNKNLINLPVVVAVYSGRNDRSGAVATASYEARKLGIKSGMPLTEAFKIADKAKKELGIEIIFLSHDYEYYEELSNNIFDEIRKNYKIQQMSIDEFSLELNNTSFEEAEKIALELNNIIKSFGFECSIGIATTQITAKIASGQKKGILVIRNAEEFLNNLDISEMPGIGKKTEQVLRNLGINTIGELAKVNIAELIKHFGEKHGKYLFNASKNLEVYYFDVDNEHEKQVSRISTLKEDSNDYYYLKSVLEILMEEVVGEVLDHKKALVGTIQILGITTKLRTVTKRKKLDKRTDNKALIYKVTLELLYELCEQLKINKIMLRRLGFSVSDLESAKNQTKLF
ncbi:MAG: DNA polymerase IV [Candidatus Micrarchaeota archaeon]|nr:DNA polymerase IV [Candidatus Micrarchaeota archaeon]